MGFLNMAIQENSGGSDLSEVSAEALELAEKNQEILEQTVDIVASFVAHNTVQVADLPNLIDDTFNALKSHTTIEPQEPEKPKPAVPIKRSITEDYIVCLEDGKKLKMLKRHLKTVYDLTPDEYRARWGLASDYPMVAPSYAARRSELAKQIGLGTTARGRRRKS
jgi:predicted transcriptional regulator